jgi:hypothetical protein
VTSIYQLPAAQQPIVSARLARALKDDDRYQSLSAQVETMTQQMDDIESDAIAAAIAEGFDDEEGENMTKGNNRVGGAP